MRTVILFTIAMLSHLCPLHAFVGLGDAPRHDYSADILEALRPHAIERLAENNADSHQREYYSKPQAVGNYVLFEGDRADTALKLIEQKVNFIDLLRQIEPKKTAKHLLLTFDTYQDVSCEIKQSVYGWNGICAPRHSVDLDVGLDIVNIYRRGDWLFEYIDAPAYKYKGLQAFFLVTDFQQTQVPSDYARNIDYLDHMTNPAEAALFDDAKCCRHDTCYTDIGIFQNFLEWLVPVASGDSLPNEYVYSGVINRPDDSCFARIDRQMANTKLFHRMLDLSIESAIENQCYFELLEQLVARYRSKELALHLKRSHFPVACCGMSSRPYLHRRDIAVLAAQTAEWNVFLRTHIDVVYDDYRKNPDGTITFLGDRTMVPVLQEFSLDVEALLLGSVLRVDNRHKNAYIGGAYNMGNVIARMPERDEILNNIRNMIGNHQLDDFNRLRMFNVYWTCLIESNSREIPESLVATLRSAVDLLPPYLAQTIDLEVELPSHRLPERQNK